MQDLLDDPEFKELQKEFLELLPARLDAIQALDPINTAQRATDFRTLVHKLAGVAGSYGFLELSEIAAKIDEKSTNQLAAGGWQSGDWSQWSQSIQSALKEVISAHLI